jgi:UDP-N-acetyl-2-amino-2-deoxyglucuronate dehydrogenase
MYTIGVVGCGRISKNHFETIQQLQKEGKAALGGCCDILPERAQEAGERWGCSAYGSMEEMLKESPCDMVALCTPSGIHPDQVCLAARYGKHILSEKPAGTKLAAVDRAIEACDAAGVQYFVVKQNRFNSTIQLLRKALEAGRFGRIHMILSNVLWTRPQNYYDMAPWRGTWEFDGGCLSNQAAHYVDMVQWMGGAVDSVQAFSATQKIRMEAEDTITVNLRFRSGALGNINVNILTYPKNLEGSITVLGEHGTVRVGGVAMNTIQEWSFADSHPMDEEVPAASYDPKNVYGSGHLVYYQEVLEALGGKRSQTLTGREGRKTVEIIEAAYQSALSGGQVRMCAMPR